MKTVILGMLSAATLMFVHPAFAQTTLIEVTGVFGNTSAPPSGPGLLDPLLSQPYSLVFTYDPSVPDTGDSTNSGDYLHTFPPNQITLTSGSITLASSEYELAAVNFDLLTDGMSLFTRGDSVADSSGLALPNEVFSLSFGFSLPLPDVSVAFLDSGLGASFSPLPAEPFFVGVPTDGGSFSVNLEALQDGTGVFLEELVSGSITSIRVVPEPGSLALLSLGILAHARRRR